MEGTERVFERLVRDHQDRIYALGLALTGNRHDAEEVAQDTFLRAYRALTGYPPDRVRDLRQERADRCTHSQLVVPGGLHRVLRQMLLGLINLPQDELRLRAKRRTELGFERNRFDSDRKLQQALEKLDLRPRSRQLVGGPVKAEPFRVRQPLDRFQQFAFEDCFVFCMLFELIRVNRIAGALARNRGRNGHHAKTQQHRGEQRIRDGFSYAG